MRKSRAVDASGELPTERTSERGLPGVPQSFLLVVVEGPDAGASAVVDAGTARLLIGTSPTCGFRLSDQKVSRRHASARVAEHELLFADLGSTNGTSINGVSLREAALRGGEVIRLGRTVITVSTRDGDSSLATARDVSFGRVLGESLAMRRLYPVLHRAAQRSDRPLLLDGETGVGKELIAEEIHAHSPRGRSPFLTLAANALPADSLDEQLFAPDGLCARAMGGTLFIDEIGSLPRPTQRQLLRAIDSIDVRFIVATRRDLDRDVMEGRFDEALLSRLAAARIEIPPLRDRAGDDLVLARFFWNTLLESEPSPDAPQTLPADFLERFDHYGWPGNVRELLFAVRARYTLGELAPWRSDLAVRDGDFLGAIVDRELPLGEARRIVIEELERRYVSYMLARFGNTKDAARASGVALRYFQLLKARLLP